MSLRLAVIGACVVTGAFHARLLAGQILDGDLADPARAVRWLIAGGVAALLIVLARRGESLVGGKAIAAWALAAMLHGPALADAPGFPPVAALPEAAISLLQISVAAVTLALLLLGATARRADRPSIARALAGRPRRRRVAARWCAPTFAPRPPPRS
jgi:hypothetical protein